VGVREALRLLLVVVLVVTLLLDEKRGRWVGCHGVEEGCPSAICSLLQVSREEMDGVSFD